MEKVLATGQAAQPATSNEFERLLEGPARVTSRYERFEQSDDLLAEASKIATALDGVIRSAKLAVTIQGRQYIQLEGWQTLGGLLGLGPKTIDTARTAENGRLAYHATVAIVDGTTGRELARAQGYCGSEEVQRTKSGMRGRWLDDAGKPQEFAILSMAQTRATVKAFAALLRWIPKLSGYAGTPYEEMEAVGLQASSVEEPKKRKKSEAPSVYIDDSDKLEIQREAEARADIIAELGLARPDPQSVLAGCLKVGATIDMIPKAYVGAFIAKIRGWMPPTTPAPAEEPLPEAFGAPEAGTINYETGEVHE